MAIQVDIAELHYCLRRRIGCTLGRVDVKKARQNQTGALEEVLEVWAACTERLPEGEDLDT